MLQQQRACPLLPLLNPFWRVLHCSPNLQNLFDKRWERSKRSMSQTSFDSLKNGCLRSYILSSISFDGCLNLPRKPYQFKVWLDFNGYAAFPKTKQKNKTTAAAAIPKSKHQPSVQRHISEQLWITDTFLHTREAPLYKTDPPRQTPVSFPHHTGGGHPTIRLNEAFTSLLAHFWVLLTGSKLPVD